MACGGCAHCGEGSAGHERRSRDSSADIIRVALVGNPNVGKSVLFNQLTGAHQIIGNWPGKAVGPMSGKLSYGGRDIDLVDLPGVYSVSGDVWEDQQIREFLLGGRTDLIINVIDSTALERNLALTIELLSLGMPMVVALNQIDRAEKHGIVIDRGLLERILGLPVIPISGLLGIGITELLGFALKESDKGVAVPRSIAHSPRLAMALDRIRSSVGNSIPEYPSDWLATRLLVGDESIVRFAVRRNPDIADIARECRESIETEMEDEISSVLMADRFAAAAGMSGRVLTHTEESRTTREETIHRILTHRVFGLVILLAVAGISFFSLFTFGDHVAGFMLDQFESLRSPFISLFADPGIGEFIWNGAIGGVLSVIAIVFPYLIPFFVLLAVLEDSGYIARVAFVMDSIMHRIGLHGKAFIPMLLGYSCNVPACMGCRIVETERERVLAIFAVTLIPCAATSIVILGLVGTYIGIAWVLGLYAFNIVMIAVLTRLAYSVLPGEPTGLIMEMPPMRRPSLKIVLRQSWIRAKDFVYIAIPLLIVVGLILGAMQYIGVLDAFSETISPLTVGWLGLPAFTGILLIFGILRKELTLLLLATVAGTMDFASVMSDIQMIVFTLIVMLYIPCIATVGALIKEIGTKRAMIITAFEIGLAILVGGIAVRVLPIIM